jgi:hypothetical protein
MTICSGCWLAPLFLGLLTLATPHMASAQGQGTAPPIHGFNGIIALPETVDAFYAGINTGLVEAGDGITHLIRATRRTKVRGGAVALDGLEPGTPLVVQYTVKGIGSSVNRATVTSVDRSRKRVALRFESGATETLRAAGKTDTHRSSRVVVYRSDEPGKGARYFKSVQ